MFTFDPANYAPAIAESLDAPASSIRVVVTEVPLTHWATGDVTLAEKEQR